MCGWTVDASDATKISLFTKCSDSAFYKFHISYYLIIKKEAPMSLEADIQWHIRVVNPPVMSEYESRRWNRGGVGNNLGG